MFFSARIALNLIVSIVLYLLFWLFLLTKSASAIIYYPPWSPENSTGDAICIDDGGPSCTDISLDECGSYIGGPDNVCFQNPWTFKYASSCLVCLAGGDGCSFSYEYQYNECNTEDRCWGSDTGASGYDPAGRVLAGRCSASSYDGNRPNSACISGGHYKQCCSNPAPGYNPVTTCESGVCPFGYKTSAGDTNCEAPVSCVPNSGQVCGTYGCCSASNVESECYNVINCAGQCVFGGIRNEGQYCGNGACSCNETSASCPQDCATPSCNTSQCSGWSSGACGTGGCPSGQRPQTRTCPAGSTCTRSQCISDPACSGGGGGGGGGGSCSVSWGISNSSPQTNSNIEVRVRGLSDSGGWQNIRLYLDGFTGDFGWGGIQNPWPTFVYPNVPSRGPGPHTLEFRVNNGARACSPTTSFTTLSNTPSNLQVSGVPPVCASEPYNVTFNWQNTNSTLWMDLTDTAGFGGYSNKNVNNLTSTTAPAGFSPSVILNPTTTYYWRLWNGSTHTQGPSFSSPACPVCTNAAGGTNQLKGCLFDDIALNPAQDRGNAPDGVTGSLGNFLIPPVADTEYTTTAIDQNWFSGEPNSFVGSDTFSGRWRGTFNFKKGTYTFKIGSDDGVKLFVDGNPVTLRDSSGNTNSWIPQSWEFSDKWKGDVNFAAPKNNVPVVLEYYENLGDARISLSWTYTPPPPPISAWVQTIGGDVHSNVSIDMGGGP